MIGLLALLGMGLAMAALTSVDDDASAGEAVAPAEAETSPPEMLSDNPEFVAPAGDEADLLAFFTTIGAETGDFSSSEAAAIVDAATLREGPLNVATEGGEDVVFGSGLDDVIDTGADDDAVLGGAGDDQVQLGDGQDVYGFDAPGFADDAQLISETGFPAELADFVTGLQASDLGNDSVWGGKGDDELRDGRGVNRLAGNEGNDLINIVDIDELTPDMAVGGWGADHMIVDEGDVAWGGHGADLVELVFPARLEAGFQPIKIADFELGTDRIELSGVATSLSHLDPATLPAELYSVEASEDGSDAMILVNGIPVVQVVGGQGLQVSDLIIS